MELIKKLKSDIKEAKTRQDVDGVVYNYLLDETNEKNISLIEAIRDLSYSTMFKILDLYVDEICEWTIGDLVFEKKHIMFEWSSNVYTIVGYQNGNPLFVKSPSSEIIEPPFSMNDKVKRLF